MANTMQWPSPGLGHAPSYQVSGIPYVTGGFTVTNVATTTITFPYVTSWIYVAHDSNQDLRLGFSANGVANANYHLVHGDASKAFAPPVFHVKCSSIFLRGDGGSVTGVTVFAGLTSIPASELNGTGPSGNNWSGSSGVG